MAICQTDPGGRKPISKLNQDLLFEIFYINAASEPPKELEFGPDAAAMNPLVITRRTSHVCRDRNTIILRSPSIWARCFNLDALSQRKVTC
ncbi:hypothetical protein HYPSUDRAFT_44045 [Hypholoma sublateritium FD-334 SS-4]|uniref:Uncharacterized protein n=1 Tax=Hypholoma sublateritium (strain FD-334 SS-4) TaxID=945553 RepID=A0A0D2KZ81_HYPSF|nr:hypothetical protein HYPSUDRAFT_44045 [Hypholoma sublateritium FD-334 SS-4]